MIDLRFGRYALGVCVAIAMLAACGGQTSNGVVPVDGAPNSSLPYHQTFKYTGAKQVFKVPAGVRHITVVALGAHGAGSPEAFGGRIYAVIPVTPGETLVVYVGGNGSGATGGYNGGGRGRFSDYGGSYGGGGASDVREHGDSLKNRVLVAGGGGGKGGEVFLRRRVHGGRGGAGGGSIGGQGQNGWPSLHSFYGLGGYGGGGGSQSIGGAGGSGGGGGGLGNPGFPGLFGVGGDGGQGCRNSYCVPGCSGAGGGGGYYGGGVGGSNSSYACGGGGGGGSSYAESSATNVRFWQGWKKSAHNGLVVFGW